MSMTIKNQVVGIFKKAVQTGTFNRVLSNVEISDVSKGKVKAEFVVSPDNANIINLLHGGYSATLFDHISTLALKSHFLADSIPPPDSVSVELSLSYISSAKQGETVVLETEAIKVGNKMAFLTGTLYSKDNKKIVATGKHTKFLLPSKAK